MMKKVTWKGSTKSWTKKSYEMMEKKSIEREAQNVRQKKKKTSYMMKKLMTNDEKKLLE